MRNELQKHKKSDKIKWIATALAVIMLGVGAAIVTDCFGLLRQNTDNYPREIFGFATSKEMFEKQLAAL